MRLSITILLVLVLLAGVGVAVLALTTPDEPVLLRFPLPTRYLELAGRVPAAAESWALIPAAAAVQRRLEENPVGRSALARWLPDQPMPGPWLLGGADLAVWRQDDETSYAIRFDGVRAIAARVWQWAASHSGEARWEGNVLVIEHVASVGSSPEDAVLRLASGLPEGHALVVQKSGERGAFPPIARPAVSSIRITPDEILVVSRAASEEAEAVAPLQPRFPRSALFSASFVSAPRILGDFDRILGLDLRDLAADGGMVVLYDANTGTLLPRPRGLLSIAATPGSRATLERFRGIVDLVGESRDTGERLLVSFDRESLGRFDADTFVDGSSKANRWALRIDIQRMLPLVRRLADHRGLRFAAPRLARAARDLERWMGALEGAAAVEASDSVTAESEELRVRILSK